jgi:hypothetical protein
MLLGRRSELCSTGVTPRYSATRRTPSSGLRDRSLIALELGGADTRENLWIEWQAPGYRDKDAFKIGSLGLLTALDAAQGSRTADRDGLATLLERRRSPALHASRELPNGYGSVASVSDVCVVLAVCDSLNPQGQ